MNAPDTLSAQQTAEEPGMFARDRALHHHVKTRGERKFDWQTYTGIGYFVNVGLSLAAVFWAERTRMGQGVLEKVGKGFELFGLDKKAAYDIGRKTFFLVGGFAVVPIMKWLEDHKLERVKEYNRAIYGDFANSDPVIVKSEKELEQTPKQSWKSIISGRALALVPFYITVGLLWGRTSRLARFTNPELGAMAKAEWRALEATNKQAFAQLTSEGMYFDKPISALSRDIGKLVASGGRYFETPHPEASGLRQFYNGVLNVVGMPLRLLKHNPAAVAQIERMEQQYPGALQSVKDLTPGHKNCDPIHSAMPYYVISEAITSAMVAWGIYVITRVTGPFFGKKNTEAAAPENEPVKPVPAPREVPPERPITSIEAASASAHKMAAAAPAPTLAHAR